jgi:membrane fusion protein, multidrug efflux system
VTGYSSYAHVQEGQYINTADSQLTTVDQVDPIWIDFSVSENELLKFRSERKMGELRMPQQDDYEVEAILGDGTVFPHKGRITFANANYNQQTSTFLLRATLPNPEGALRAGQFVRVHVLGAIRPGAILVPQQAVLQGAQGFFVIIVDKENKAQIRPVQVGPWYGDQWFITSGLGAGDTVVVDGMVRLSPGAPVKIVEAAAKAPAADAKPTAAAGAGQTKQ